MSKGYVNKYDVKNYSVKEVYTKSEENEHDNYYIEIIANNIVYNYQFYIDIDDNYKMVKDVLYYDGEYKCLLPVLSDSIKVDIMCYKNKKYFNYQDIKGEEEKLDKFVSELSKEKYDFNYFSNKTGTSDQIKKIKYYKDNIPDNYFITVTTLNGVAIFSDKVEVVDLFESDVYKRELSTFVNDYYVSANYDDKQEFREIFLVNVLTGKKKILKAPNYVSFDSYIQGVVDDCLYIYDLNNEKQYKIDINKLKIYEIGNKEKGIKYFDGKIWSDISVIKANQKQLFKDKNAKEKSEQYSYKYGRKLSGFNYYFEKEEDGYSVYRANVQRNKVKKYLFNVDNYNNAIFEEDYVLYKKNNKLYLYSEYIGTKIIIEDDELEFNENILFDIYKK